MAETLLGLSEVLLFGREVEDLQIRGPASADHQATVATTEHLGSFNTTPIIDGEQVADGDTVLVHRQNNTNISQEDLYEVKPTGTAWVPKVVAVGETVFVQKGDKNHDKLFVRRKPKGKQHRFTHAGGRRGLGRNKQLDQQLEEDARFARIYGFSYEGAYFELPNPTLFLVHGEGESVTDDNQPDDHASRAPTNPSVSGVAAADFQFADDIQVWAYDKADYTIRMDVETGMFEQVLLDVMFDGGGPGGVAGANVRGANVRGANVRGANVRGANVRGANVRGANVRGGGGGD